MSIAKLGGSWLGRVAKPVKPDYSWQAKWKEKHSSFTNAEKFFSVEVRTKMDAETRHTVGRSLSGVWNSLQEHVANHCLECSQVAVACSDVLLMSSLWLQSQKYRRMVKRCCGRGEKWKQLGTGDSGSIDETWSHSQIKYVFKVFDGSNYWWMEWKLKLLS
jgi:hypothetical protein